MAARSKASVCRLSLAGIVGLNPTEGMAVCLLLVLCVVRERSVRRAGHSSRGVLPSVVCECECDLKTSTKRRPRPIRVLSPKNKLSCTFYTLLFLWKFVFLMSFQGPGVIIADFLISFQQILDRYHTQAGAASLHISSNPLLTYSSWSLLRYTMINVASDR